VVHIGIDVHVRESQICILREDGVVEQRRVATRRDRLQTVLGGEVRARILLEASGQSEWVAACLEELGHDVIVADPNFAPMYPSRRRIKTDRRDAEALAIACAKGTYRGVHRRSAAQRAVQLQLTVREHLVQVRTQLINVARATVGGHGARIPSGAAETVATRVRALDVPAPVRGALTPVLELLDQVTARLETLDRELAATAAATPAVHRLMTVPGVGPVTALAFVATLDAAPRFARADQVASFLGLVPGEHSSGDHCRRGRITKRGPRRLRWLLVQAAWCVWRSARAEVSALRAWAHRLGARRGTRVAVVALARRLATIVFAMWRDGTRFRAAGAVAA
jgi:transposase